MLLKFNYGVKGTNDKHTLEFQVDNSDLIKIKKNILVRKKHLHIGKKSVTLNFYYDVKSLNEELKEIERYLNQKDEEKEKKKNNALWKKLIKPSFSSNNINDIDHVINLLKFKKNNFMFSSSLTENQAKNLILSKIPFKSPFFYDFIQWRMIYYFPQIILVIFVILTIFLSILERVV